MTRAGVVAVALTAHERDLLVSAVRLLEEHGADTEETRPLVDLLERALPAGEIQAALEAAAA